MAKKRCTPCGGSGRVMGGGMMMTDCDYCDGVGKVAIVDEDEIDTLLAKETDHYKEAIKGIKAIDVNITDEQADKMFKEELTKIKAKEKKKKEK